jgi:hypothetical protein
MRFPPEANASGVNGIGSILLSIPLRNGTILRLSSNRSPLKASETMATSMSLIRVGFSMSREYQPEREITNLSHARSPSGRSSRRVPRESKKQKVLVFKHPSVFLSACSASLQRRVNSARDNLCRLLSPFGLSQWPGSSIKAPAIFRLLPLSGSLATFRPASSPPLTPVPDQILWHCSSPARHLEMTRGKRSKDP